MKLGIVSDSHRNIATLQNVYDRLVREHKIDLFVHLGDDYDDVDSIALDDSVRLIRVPGVFSDFYQDKNIPNRIIEEFEGKKFLFTHSPMPHQNDPQSEKSPSALADEHKVDVVLYGHTHFPRVEETDGISWINPGIIKTNDKRMDIPTYAVIDIQNGFLSIAFFNALDGGEFFVDPE